MRLAMPDTVRRLPLEYPDLAIQEYAAIIGELRGVTGGVADLEVIGTEAVETAMRAGAVLMAVVTPPDAAPALLTGIALDVPPSWDPDTAETLRDSMEDVGGPDVRETVLLETGLGPAVLAQRIPGVEQARSARPLALQLQAFLPEPGTGRMLLLTLACPSATGWDAHQLLFSQIVRSATTDAAEEPADEESFENHTWQV
jgi:hypothetical protein